MSIDLNMYRTHCIYWNVMFWQFNRCTIACVELGLTVIFSATGRSRNFPSLFLVESAEAFIVICQVSPIIKYWFIPEVFIIVVISAFKTKISSLHVFQFFTSELVPQLHIPFSSPPFVFLNALDETTGQKSHRHQQDDGTAHNGGNHCYFKSKSLIFRYGFA